MRHRESASNSSIQSSRRSCSPGTWAERPTIGRHCSIRPASLASEGDITKNSFRPVTTPTSTSARSPNRTMSLEAASDRRRPISEPTECITCVDCDVREVECAGSSRPHHRQAQFRRRSLWRPTSQRPHGRRRRLLRWAQDTCPEFDGPRHAPRRKNGRRIEAASLLVGRSLHFLLFHRTNRTQPDTSCG